MNEIKYFTSETCKEIKNYVYRLIDPRNGLTFYVGRGRGNRVFAHINEALGKVEGDDQHYIFDDDSDKIATIKEIRNSGHNVIHVIQRWGMDEEVAKEVESALIDAYFGLTNRVSGSAHSHGVCTVEWLEEKFGLTEYIDDFALPPYIIIKVQWWRINEMKFSSFPERLYHAVRHCWKIADWRANTRKLPYVLAVVDGVVREVYKVDKWTLVPDGRGRFAFEGVVAETSIRDHYLNHYIPQKYKSKGAQTPFMYRKE